MTDREKMEYIRGLFERYPAMSFRRVMERLAIREKEATMRRHTETLATLRELGVR